MALENIQYDEIMREYDRRRHRSRRLQEERREQAYRLVPRLKEIQNTIASLSAGRIHALLGKGSRDDNAVYQKKLEALAKERTTLLTAGGFPPDYLEMPYQCPLCRDTGYTDNGRCVC